jgi:hypothetical protein
MMDSEAIFLSKRSQEYFRAWPAAVYEPGVYTGTFSGEASAKKRLRPGVTGRPESAFEETLNRLQDQIQNFASSVRKSVRPMPGRIPGPG